MAENKEFTAITTQEELDRIILDRLDKAKKSTAAKYEGFISPDDVSKIRADYDKQISDLNSALKAANDKAASYDKDIADRDTKIKNYETQALKTRIARESGIPFELADRLTGDNEDALRSDAESFSKLISSSQGTPPMASTEPPVETDAKRAAMRSMLREMKGEQS